MLIREMLHGTVHLHHLRAPRPFDLDLDNVVGGSFVATGFTIGSRSLLAGLVEPVGRPDKRDAEDSFDLLGLEQTAGVPSRARREIRFPSGVVRCDRAR